MLESMPIWLSVAVSSTSHQLQHPREEMNVGIDEHNHYKYMSHDKEIVHIDV